MVAAAVLEKRGVILAKSMDIPFYIIIMIILYAFETGMPATYEWRNYPGCMEIFLSGAWKQFYGEKTTKN
jgi:hypothetical protein